MCSFHFFKSFTIKDYFFFLRLIPKVTLATISVPESKRNFQDLFLKLQSDFPFWLPFTTASTF